VQGQVKPIFEKHNPPLLQELPAIAKQPGQTSSVIKKGTGLIPNNPNKKELAGARIYPATLPPTKGTVKPVIKPLPKSVAPKTVSEIQLSNVPPVQGVVNQPILEQHSPPLPQKLPAAAAQPGRAASIPVSNGAAKPVSQSTGPILPLDLNNKQNHSPTLKLAAPVATKLKTVPKPLSKVAAPKPAPKSISVMDHRPAVAKTTVFPPVAIPRAAAKTAVRKPFAKTAIPKPISLTDHGPAFAKAAVQKPVEKAAIQKPVAKTAVQKLVAKTAVQKPVATAAVPKPVAKIGVQNTVAKTAIKPVLKTAVPNLVKAAVVAKPAPKTAPPKPISMTDHGPANNPHRAVSKAAVPKQVLKTSGPKLVPKTAIPKPTDLPTAASMMGKPVLKNAHLQIPNIAGIPPPNALLSLIDHRPANAINRPVTQNSKPTTTGKKINKPQAQQIPNPQVKPKTPQTIIQQPHPLPNGGKLNLQQSKLQATTPVKNVPVGKPVIKKPGTKTKAPIGIATQPKALKPKVVNTPQKLNKPQIQRVPAKVQQTRYKPKSRKLPRWILDSARVTTKESKKQPTGQKKTMAAQGVIDSLQTKGQLPKGQKGQVTKKAPMLGALSKALANVRAEADKVKSLAAKSQVELTGRTDSEHKSPGWVRKVHKLTKTLNKRKPAHGEETSKSTPEWLRKIHGLAASLKKSSVRGEVKHAKRKKKNLSVWDAPPWKPDGNKAKKFKKTKSIHEKRVKKKKKNVKKKVSSKTEGTKLKKTANSQERSSLPARNDLLLGTTNSLKKSPGNALNPGTRSRQTTKKPKQAVKVAKTSTKPLPLKQSSLKSLQLSPTTSKLVSGGSSPKAPISKSPKKNISTLKSSSRSSTPVNKLSPDQLAAYLGPPAPLLTKVGNRSAKTVPQASSKTGPTSKTVKPKGPPPWFTATPAVPGRKPGKKTKVKIKVNVASNG
jgi:hypothetical protein